MPRPDLTVGGGADMQYQRSAGSGNPTVPLRKIDHYAFGDFFRNAYSSYRHPVRRIKQGGDMQYPVFSWGKPRPKNTRTPPAKTRGQKFKQGETKYAVREHARAIKKAPSMSPTMGAAHEAIQRYNVRRYDEEIDFRRQHRLEQSHAAKNDLDAYFKAFEIAHPAGRTSAWDTDLADYLHDQAVPLFEMIRGRTAESAVNRYPDFYERLAQARSGLSNAQSRQSGRLMRQGRLQDAADVMGERYAMWAGTPNAGFEAMFNRYGEAAQMVEEFRRAWLNMLQRAEYGGGPTTYPR